MWQPSRTQWAVIWVTFAVCLYCFFWGNQARWVSSDILEPREYRTLGWFALVGGALAVWFLEGRRHLASTSLQSSRTVGDEGGVRLRKTVVNIASVAVLLWALLVLLATLVGESRGSVAGSVGLSALFAAYGLALVKRDRRAVPMTWVLVVLFGLATMLSGLVPLMILVWLLLLAFAFFVRRNRDEFTRKAGNQAV